MPCTRSSSGSNRSQGSSRSKSTAEPHPKNTTSSTGARPSYASSISTPQKGSIGTARIPHSTPVPPPPNDSAAQEGEFETPETAFLTSEPNAGQAGQVELVWVTWPEGSPEPEEVLREAHDDFPRHLETLRRRTNEKFIRQNGQRTYPVSEAHCRTHSNLPDHMQLGHKKSLPQQEQWEAFRALRQRVHLDPNPRTRTRISCPRANS